MHVHRTPGAAGTAVVHIAGMHVANYCCSSRRLTGHRITRSRSVGSRQCFYLVRVERVVEFSMYFVYVSYCCCVSPANAVTAAVRSLIACFEIDQTRRTLNSPAAIGYHHKYSYSSSRYSIDALSPTADCLRIMTRARVITAAFGLCRGCCIGVSRCCNSSTS